MSRSLRGLLQPYVCEACRARTARPVSFTRHAARSLHTRAALSAPNVAQDAKFVEKRIKELGGLGTVKDYYPRWQPLSDATLMSADSLRKEYSHLQPDETDMNMVLGIYGRLVSRRKASSTLWFLDIESGNSTIQVLVNSSVLMEKQPGLDAESIRKGRSSIRRGDWLTAIGVPHRTSSGELSLQATKLPQIMALSLQPVPEDVTDAEFISRNRHVDRIVHQSSRDVILLRHELVARLRQFLIDRDFVEVNTPLLVAEAGGAVARPFETYATEFRETKLNLRVAPELFLKRLIVGNMDKVFEIGSSFRNEGVDATHNPEFSTCEFYAVMTSLSELTALTEGLFYALANATSQRQEQLISIPKPDTSLYKGPYPQIDFIPALEEAISETLPSWKLPDLSQQNSLDEILATFEQLSLEVPADATLPRLLDELAAHFLEPRCISPTWIINHPECMSPLAKSFDASPSGKSGIRHRVSARAELFIQEREYVNCYEEENSPIEQRRKFTEQIAMKRTGGPQTGVEEGRPPAETHGVVDESYIGALEYGMPPTGGWGCGIDRIVMLFAGRNRIADVLPFGTLTNVVALSSVKTKKNAKP